MMCCVYTVDPDLSAASQKFGVTTPRNSTLTDGTKPDPRTSPLSVHLVTCKQSSYPRYLPLTLLSGLRSLLVSEAALVGDSRTFLSFTLHQTFPHLFSCSLLEMQTFLVALIKDFEFTLPENPPKVRRERALFMVPTVDGKIHLPLNVTPVSR